MLAMPDAGHVEAVSAVSGPLPVGGSCMLVMVIKRGGGGRRREGVAVCCAPGCCAGVCLHVAVRNFWMPCLKFHAHTCAPRALKVALPRHLLQPLLAGQQWVVLYKRLVLLLAVTWQLIVHTHVSFGSQLRWHGGASQHA
jgi:hypothetical protein